MERLGKAVFGGLAGAAVAFVLGSIWANMGSGGVDGGEAMGRGFLLIFVLLPAGFVLGAVGVLFLPSGDGGEYVPPADDEPGDEPGEDAAEYDTPRADAPGNRDDGPGRDA